MNPRVWCFDLEMNKPSNKIIQIGAVVGNLHDGKILTKYSVFINPEEQLDPFIIGLTGITQNQVDTGIPLGVAKGELDELITKYHACKSPVVWGNGDLRTIKAQGGTGYFQGTYRELDIKTIHQFMSLSRGLSMRGGLEKSLGVYGLKFEGKPHNALDDAINTFRIAYHFQKMFKVWDLHPEKKKID